MIILHFLLFAFWFTIVPFGIGLNYNRWHGMGRIFSWLETYLYGLMTELVLFQIIAVCLTFLRSTLSLVTILWLAGCGLLLMVGIWTGIIRKRALGGQESESLVKGKKRRGTIDRTISMSKTFEGRFIGRQQRSNKWEKWIVTVMVVVLVLFQVVFVTLHVHDDQDDAWYVGTAVISYFTDTLNQVSPYSMEVLENFNPDYVLSPWPIFCAMIGRLSVTHPAIVMHTFVPVLMIPLAYMVYWLIGYEVFEQNKIQLLWLLFFLCVLNIFGNWSIRSTSTFLLFRIWQGKAILCNIIIPLVIYTFIQLVNAQDKIIPTLMLLVTIMAGTMVSSMGVFLGPAMLLVLSVVDVINHRKIENAMISFGCIIPCIIQFGLYLWMRN